MSRTRFSGHLFVLFSEAALFPIDWISLIAQQELSQSKRCIDVDH